uniref:BTB domain-containing protein n=1 Tax=Biomphalaria glabrata TaxID=6526 RepID=A0A2C9LUZ0_BIOGL
MTCNNDTTKKINGTAQSPSSSDKEHAFDSQKIELLRAFISSRAFTEINNTSQSDHSADSVSQNSRQKANTARLLQNLLTSEVAKKPLKINVNTNAHGDQNSQPTIVTHNKPTHGSQKFLVRKDKQWNNGDGCEPSYIIHIESRTDQSSVCSKPPIETRRRRGDIVRMKRLEIAGEGSLSTPHSRHSESESPHGKRSSEKTQNNDSQFSNDGRQRPNSETDKADHEISLKSSDRRRALSDRKEQGDHRSVNFNLRLIDHLERKETSPNNSEPLTLRNDVTAGSVNKVTKIPVVFKESITWISKQASPASGSVGKNLVHAHNGNQSKHSLRSNGDRCPKFEIDISDNFNDNSDTNKMLHSHRPRPSNGLEKENGSNSPKVTNGSRPRHKNDREEGKAYTLPYVSLPWEVMSPVYGKNYEDLLPFVKVTHVRDVACQYSPPSEDDNQEGERVHLANTKCSRTLLNAQQGHHETNISGNAVWSQEREESINNYFEEATHNEMTLRASDSDKHRKSIPMESSCSISCKSRHVVSKSETFAKKPSKRKKNHVCRKSEGRIHSEQSKVSCESPESLISCDGERYRPDSPLPSWSGQNYNPNANFSSCEISPYSETGIRRQVWPTGHPSLCSSSEQDTEGLMNPHLNENYSNQRSAQSSDGEPIDEAIVLEPLNPSMLYMPTKDTPSPRYSSHVSQEKLQKLIEEAKANSRASVKILDQNTNFDVDGTYQEKETQDVTNTFIGEYLYKLWKNECLCDVKVTVEDVDFFVHKLVLAAFSNVFCPSTPQPPPSVCFNVPCSTPDAVNQIFNYIYTSSMELKDDLLEPILSAAIFMGISEVIEVINEILMKPTMENLELYIKVKRRHGTYVSLATFPKLYQNHFLELISQDSFLNMTITEFEQILQDPDVLVTSELDTISGIASWVKYNACERSSYLSRLLRCVSFESISPKLLACISEQYSYLFNIPGAPQVISEAFKFHALKLETQCGSYPPTSPCKPTKKQMKGNLFSFFFSTVILSIILRPVNVNAAIMEESCAKLEEQLDADVSESYNMESVAGLKSNCTSPRSKEDTETFDTQEISSLETCCNAEKQEILAFPQDASPQSDDDLYKRKYSSEKRFHWFTIKTTSTD